MEKQDFRNALAAIEDEARALRRTPSAEPFEAFDLIVRLTQLIREEIVK